MNLIEWIRWKRTKLGLKFLRNRRSEVTEELNWYLAEHVEERLPAGANSYDASLFFNKINARIIDLLSSNANITALKKRVDINNGDTVITISYITNEMFNNLLNWACGHLTGNAAADIGDLIESGNQGESSFIKEGK